MKIIVDTREQHPLFKKNVINKKLDVGDYSIEGCEKQFAIERKSALDLFGTLGKGHKRFKNELTKALEYDYFAIVVEDNYDNILNKSFEGAYHSKMRGYVITSILFTIHLKYKIPIFFANGRVEAKHIVKELIKTYTKTRGTTNGKETNI